MESEFQSLMVRGKKEEKKNNNKTKQTKKQKERERQDNDAQSQFSVCKCVGLAWKIMSWMTGQPADFNFDL